MKRLPRSRVPGSRSRNNQTAPATSPRSQIDQEFRKYRPELRGRHQGSGHHRCPARPSSARHPRDRSRTCHDSATPTPSLNVPYAARNVAVRPEVAEDRELVSVAIGERTVGEEVIARDRQAPRLHIGEVAEVVADLAQLAGADAAEREREEHQHDVLAPRNDDSEMSSPCWFLSVKSGQPHHQSIKS